MNLKGSVLKSHWKESIFIGIILLVVFTMLYSVNTTDRYYEGKQVQIDEKIIVRKGSVITQKFVADKSTLSGVSLLIEKLEGGTGCDLTVELSEKDNLIHEWKVNSKKLNPSTYNRFELPKRLKNVYGKEFAVTIKVSKSNELAIFACVSPDKGTFIGDGKDYTGCICLYQVYRVISKGTILFVLSILSILIMGVFIFLGIKNQWKIENQYLLMAVILGSIYLCAIPFSRVPDEVSHYLRVYEISEGHVLSDKSPKNGVGGQNMGKNIIPEDFQTATHVNYFSVIRSRGEVIDSSDKEWYSFGAASLYSPVSYIFQLPGIFIAKMISNKSLAIAYAGRLSSLIFSILLIYLAIMIIPVKKYMIIFIAMMPVFLQEMGSLATDSLTNAISILVVAYALYLAYNEDEHISKRQIALMYILSMVLALTKIVYVPLCFIFFIVPVRKFGSKKRYLKIVLSVVGIALFVNIAWLLVASGYLSEFQEGVDSAKQISGILTNPFRYLMVAINTLIYNGEFYIKSCIGSSLCWFDVDINSLLVWIYVFIIGYIAQRDLEDSKEILVKDKVIIGSIAAVITVLIATSLYVQFTPVDADLINGIQGRYFVPILLAIAAMFNLKNSKLKAKNINMYLYPMIGLVHVSAVISLVLANL